MSKAPQIQKKITVSGLVLVSTIDTMESFGKIGHDVLKSFGIEKINPKKQYPYEIRSAIHKAALDRFGEESVLAFGFNHGEKTLDHLVPTLLANHLSLIEYLGSSQNVTYDVLDEFIRVMVKDLNKNISGATQGVKDVSYGFAEKKISRKKYHFRATLAADIYQEAFIRGAIVFLLTKFVSKSFTFELSHLPEHSTTGYGFSEFHMVATFEKTISNLSSSEILAQRKTMMRDKLMQVILKKSDEQNDILARLSNQLGKYIPPQVHRQLVEGDQVATITTLRKKLTIFFSDIKNFTAISERLQPEDLTKYLNEYFSQMTSIAIKHGATIDKYIGDAMMVFFGDPESKGERDDARACVEMALEMREKMKQLKIKWSSEGFSEPFEARMGINTGYCNVGNFGSDQRLTYTIVGGEVNVAARLEAAADTNGILLSYETYAHCQDIVEVETRTAIKMKGITREIKIFSVIGRKLKKKKKVNKNRDANDLEQNYSKITKSFESEIANLKKEIFLLKKQISEISKQNN